MDTPTLLNVVIASLVALYFAMLAGWRRYPAAGIILIGFVSWIAAFGFLVWTGATEAFQ